MSNDCLSFGYSFTVIVRYGFYTLYIFLLFFAVNSEIDSILWIFYSLGWLFLIIKTKKTSSLEGRFAFILVFYSKNYYIFGWKHIQRPRQLKGNLPSKRSINWQLSVFIFVEFGGKSNCFFEMGNYFGFFCASCKDKGWPLISQIYADFSELCALRLENWDWGLQTT